jgi:bacterial/archaeal transporter family-2 protein
MDRTVAVVVAAVVGGVVVTQGPLNSQLARSVGGLQATVVALGISFTAILAASLLTGGIGDLRNLGDAPWYAVIGGGLAGALFVGSIVWTIRALGVGGLTAITIAAQLGLAIVIDHYGWLGVDRSPVTTAKVAGLVLLAAGTWLILRD